MKSWPLRVKLVVIMLVLGYMLIEKNRKEKEASDAGNPPAAVAS